MAAAPPTIHELPDHVLTEVMLRVPTPAALVHAAAVSKGWRRVVTSTSKFLEDYRARHKSSPFLGLYIPRKFDGLPSFQMADSIQSGAAGDDLDLQHAAAKVSSFSLSGLEIHPEWRLLDCYNGRLLLARGGESLEVYNPLSQQRVSVDLPQDFILPDGFSTCLLQGHGDHGSSFRVVSVQSHRRDRMVHAVEYDSCRKSWNHHRDWKILKNIEGAQREVMHAGSLVFCKYTGPSLLLLDTREMQFSVLPLPADNHWKRYAIGQMEDGVCCLVSVEPVGKLNTTYLRVWRLEKLNWKLEKAMELAQVLGKHAPDGTLYYRARKVTDGMAVLCSSGRDLHFVVDLKTFCVMGKFEFSKDLPAFPMQMHWPPVFSVATISGEQSRPAARGVEVESAKTDGDCEQEAGKNEDAAEDPYTKGEPVASVPTPTAVKECFEKENNVPTDYDLEALVPGLCDRVSDLMNPEVTRLHCPERRESFVRLDHDAQCPFSVSNELHPDYRIKDSELSMDRIKQVGTPDPIPEDDEAEEGKKLVADGEVLAVALQRQKNKSMNPPVATISVMNSGSEGAEIDFRRRRQLGECGDSPPPPPDHLRCRRSDGKKWRCVGHALPTVSFCKYHYTKANKGKKLPVDGEVLAVDLQRQNNKIMNPPMAAISEEGPAQTSGENEDAVEDSDTKGDAAEDSPPRGRRRKRAATLIPASKDDEAEETPVPSGRRQRQKSGERGDCPVPPPDHLRCRRRDGKNWHCSGRALPTVSFCEYHYVKANKGKKLPLPADGEVLVVALHRQKNKSINPPVAAISVMNPSSSEGVETWQQSGERGDSLPDHLQCRRSDGKKWRCSGRALPTVSFCEYHYVKASKGKKLPADGEVLAVALQRLKNKGKGRKNCKKDFCNSCINKWIKKKRMPLSDQRKSLNSIDGVRAL